MNSILNQSNASKSLKYKFSIGRDQSSTGLIGKHRGKKTILQSVELSTQPVKLGENPTVKEAGPTIVQLVEEGDKPSN